MKKKGIVLEIRGQYLIVMTSSGEFCKVPPAEGLITEGEEIEFTHTLEASGSTPARGKRYAWKSWTYAAAACLLLLITALPLWNMVFASAYAMVSIDINPSFELEVDEKYEVTDVHALNKDAERIMPDIDWQKHTLTEVTKDILSEARKQGYLEKNHDVLIVPVGLKDPAASQELLEVMKKEVPLFTGDGMGELTITMMESTKEIREQARKLGVSAGKYALYDSMKRIDKNFNEDSIRSMSISEVSSAIGGFKNIPNAVQYSNVPSTLKKERKDKPVQVPTAPKQLADKAEASPHKKPEPHKKQTASVHVERDNLPVKRTPKLTEQEQKDKSKGVPKLIAADTKHKAEVQAQKDAKRSEEDKKYNSGYGQQQQQSQQGGRTIKKEEKERNEKYKEEREQSKQNVVHPLLKETEKKTQQTDGKKEVESDKKSTSSTDKDKQVESHK
ncbi:hypothetical protein AM501_17035 [Aneurinibacillus migulanus]|uniref:anti-sigma factor domain-containing protein n=1 Tax=Aneurinibacillus migulanus TaxID=47500 RepID=UPI0005BE654B|nr:anti-sigma factor domain-containing protein [Aneurinibacillus migulanus]KIV60008.1 hypothetical protein TS64_00725 [Aneurinibacillus migulanus]KPD07207.1 hypothetical protein AM501_17035 [Aneurinibacillus migulanus]MCP1354779.1 anti-sigma factor domain-containing protein [Aneurinibacillus migulanus]